MGGPMKDKVYLDACMIIDLVEGSADQQDRLSSALKGHNLVSSELARMESRIRILTWDDIDSGVQQPQMGDGNTPSD
jgi:hypothetical protein